MTQRYRFPCGCEFPILQPSSDPDVLPLLDFDIENIPETCPAVWEMLGRGDTKGVFQLESPLGRQWCKKLKPESCEHMGALGALLRPGPLQGKDEEGISLTEHYVRRKNGLEQVVDLHPVLKPILENTYGVLTFQEQSMRIAKDLAGFDLIAVDRLRKGIGKKIQSLLHEIGEEFITGCKKTGVVDEETAKTVWSWIKATGRYQFNKCLSERQNVILVSGELVSAKWLYQTVGSGIYGPVMAWSMNRDGFVVPNEVVRASFEGHQQTYVVTTAGGRTISVTADHKFPTPRGLVPVCKLTIHEDLYVFDGPGRRVTNDWVMGVREDTFCAVYDIEMAAPHHNFVVDGGIVTCNSHADSYGVRGYKTAYVKAHFPLAFFTSWLRNAKHKSDPQEEVFELVNDAKLFDVVVEPPDVRSLQADVHTDRKVVKFGLANIKGVGDSHVAKLKEVIQAHGKSVGEMSWWEFLVHLTPQIPSSVVAKLAEAGALRCFKMGRQAMLADYKAWSVLSGKEQEWVRERFGQFSSLLPALKALAAPRYKKAQTVSTRVPKKGREAEVDKLLAERKELSQTQNKIDMDLEVGEEVPADLQDEISRRWEVNERTYLSLTKVKRVETVPEFIPEGEPGGCMDDRREGVVRSAAQLLEFPPSAVVDTPQWVAWIEEQLLGVSLTCSKIDSCDISAVNCSCKEFLSGRTGFIMLGVEVQQAREVKTKRGKSAGAKMAFLTLSDSSCSLSDVVCFPESWKEYGHLLTEGNTVIVQGERDQKDKESRTLFVKKVWQAK